MNIALYVLIFSAFTAQPGLSQKLQSPTSKQRRDLLSVRESVWQSWYQNDWARLKSLVPRGLIAIDPGEANWKPREQFLDSAKDFAAHQGRLISLNIPRDRNPDFR